MRILKSPLYIVFLCTLLGIPVPAVAADLPTVPIGELTSELYSFSLKIVGLAIFVMFIIAGLARMVPALQKTVGDPTTIIKNAIIGFVILVSAYVVLSTINPDLVGSSETSGPAAPAQTLPTSGEVGPVGGGVGAPVNDTGQQLVPIPDIP